MKTLSLMLILSLTAIYFLIPNQKPDQGCLVHFDTSKGPASFYLAAKDIDGLSKGTREDRTQKPNWCFWFICSYPRVESSWVMTRDMTSYHVQDTFTAAEAKIQACKPSFHAKQ
jgi:hypothetical protein